ncbi:MAG: Protein YeeZ [uncultured Adhaeribacter sp.]|uniref:Protein YeeZ n=1 Tax=uncultured Adhaeribacter sp. TaxID=448109 RepID=A0A6J4JTM7_9BACT|nr:MAG: Protein YeeZ [uncultured Adhaeribacter sp.]
MNDQGKTVSILGCGWLGLPLAEQLIWSGYQVKGSTTTPEKLNLLQAKKIEPFLLNLADSAGLENIPSFLDADSLIVSLPPRLRAGQGSQYLNQINLLTQALQQAGRVQQVLFISSTSVYQDVNAVITEAHDHQALKEDNPLRQAETLLQQSTAYKTTILRFGGLVGGNRHPGRFLAGKTNVPQPQAPVNLIHLDDCLRLCQEIITGPGQNEVYNACADHHPSREEFYSAAARALHLPPPQFNSKEPCSFKIINNEKIKAAYRYHFIHPDPMFFF